MHHRLALAPGLYLGGYWRDNRAGGFDRRFRRQSEVTTAIFAHLNVFAVHQGVDGADWNAQMTAGANLMAGKGDALLAPGGQATVVLENGEGDFLAQFGNRRFGGAVLDVAEFKFLELEQILEKYLDGTGFKRAHGT